MFWVLCESDRQYKVQYSQTNMMRFLFSLLRIKGLYMFQELLAHPQEVLHKRHLVYCVRYVSWLLPGLEWSYSSTPILVAIAPLQSW
jgi:hypothetical protein